MKNRYMVRLSALLGVFLISSAIHCTFSQKRGHDFKKQGVLRLIDYLDSSHILATPFADLISKFQSVEDDLTENLFLFRELSTSKQKVWGATTHRTILGPAGSRAPEGMEVFLDGISVNFLSGQNGQAIQWKWIGTNQEIDIKYDDNYNRGFKCLILDLDDSFSFETILPDAPVEFEIYGRRNRHPQDLEIYLDGEQIGKTSVRRNNRFLTFSAGRVPGTHKIMLKSSLSKKLIKTGPTPPRLLIYQVKVKTKNDVILFFVPADEQENFTNKKITTTYITDQDESGSTNPWTELYRIKQDFTLDQYAQDNNPENVKKNIILENLSFNALVAPPQSRYEFELNIPEEGFLEFGVGIFAYKESQENQAATFKIIAEFNRTKKILYENTIGLEPEPLRDQIKSERIDLSAFGSKKIKLTFLTENVSEQNHGGENPFPFAFWSNPIIYRPESKNLNVILISLDTLRADHLGCYGYERPTSPAIDELAKESVLFENTYAQSPWTLPSHMSMLFSLNSASHQVYFYNQKIDSSLPSLATFLKRKGYITYAFTGGGYVSNIYGFSKGFDWYDEPVGGRKAPLGNNEAETVFQYTSGWLENNKDKPFFLFLHTYQIHGPYSCPSPWNELFLEENAPWKRLALRNFLDDHGEDYAFTPEEQKNIIALYDEEIRYTNDTLIDPLILRLKELGIYDNTLLIITSDHGEEFNDHGGWLHGRTVYDELIRVPLVIKFPASAYKGRKIQAKSRLIDILPTVLELASIRYDKKEIEGESLISLIKGQEIEDRIFISDLAHKNVLEPCPAIIATNKNDLKFIIHKSKEGIKYIETYDLMRDPQEKLNILRQAQKLREGAIKFLDKYYAEKSKIQRSKERIRLDKELEEKLKALGYLR